jgi:hypothetical protein
MVMLSQRPSFPSRFHISITCSYILHEETARSHMVLGQVDIIDGWSADTEVVHHPSSGLRFETINYQLRRLQVIQNSAARLICGVGHRDQLHVKPILRELHWLPVEASIIFKCLCLVFKCIHCETAPVYLKELISLGSSSSGHRQLRSTNTPTLLHPPQKTLKTYGNRAFYVRAPALWNKLSCELRNISVYNTFKTGLKTHLFREFHN